jgi:hypothetical protein
MVRSPLCCCNQHGLPALKAPSFIADFVLSKLCQPDDLTAEGRRWRYLFRKVDGNNKLIIYGKIYSDLRFNKENRLIAFHFQ